MPGAELEIREIHAKRKIVKGAPFYKSHCWVDPVATSFERFILWHFFMARNGLYMVLLIGSSWILIIGSGDASCQISDP